MSWTTFYPVFECNDAESDGEAAREVWEVRAIYNPKRAEHVVSVSLFPERNVHVADLIDWLGGKEREPSWLTNLLRESEALSKIRPDLSLRVYLDPSLSGASDRLVAGGLEVYLMENKTKASLARLRALLPLEENGILLTVASIQNLHTVPSDADRTLFLKESGLGAWRMPGTSAEEGLYAPIRIDYFGAQGGMPFLALLNAFVRRSASNELSRTIGIPGRVPIEARWSRLESEDLDCCFLATALYPRLAAHGLLTFLSDENHPPLLILDIEYATWANSSSQVLFYPLPRCCGGA